MNYCIFVGTKIVGTTNCVLIIIRKLSTNNLLGNKNK